MEFRRKKLPKEESASLRAYPISGIAPFALMPAPVYVLMRRNEKFVSVKAPLDFFTPEELARLSPFETFFFPESIEICEPFRNAGRRVRSILSGRRDQDQGSAARSSLLPPAPFELSDQVLRAIGPLWGYPEPMGARSDLAIEPFFVAIFVNELCERIPENVMRSVRDANLRTYEQAVLVSSWAVFLALHLGWLDLGFLSGLRLQLFEAEAEAREAGRFSAAAAEIVEVARASFSTIEEGRFFSGLFDALEGGTPRKLQARLKRVRGQLVSQGARAASIYGEKGFADG